MDTNNLFSSIALNSALLSKSSFVIHEEFRGKAQGTAKVEFSVSFGPKLNEESRELKGFRIVVTANVTGYVGDSAEGDVFFEALCSMAGEYVVKEGSSPVNEELSQPMQIMFADQLTPLVVDHIVTLAARAGIQGLKIPWSVPAKLPDDNKLKIIENES